ncbi:MAG: endonuclease MutS2 [Vicinamibacterales bacterium]
MLQGALKALEFDSIVQVVRGLAVTPLGRRRLEDLAPSSDVDVVTQALAITTEASRFLVDFSGFPLRAPDDLTDIIDSVSVPGHVVEPPRLAAFATFLESVEQCGLAIRRVVHGEFPQLARIAASITSFEHEVAAIRRAIDPSGEVVDHASPQLRSIRDRLRRQRARLRGTLESYLRGKDTAKYLQDQVITDRNGRYVLLVRAEHRLSIPGIIHGSSASGASLFLEPLSTVEINNEIVALQEEETAEIFRILLALTDALRSRREELEALFEAAAAFDVAQACGRFSRLVDGVAPRLTTDTTIELRAARHPLLLPSVDARVARSDRTGELRSAPPVPVDIRLTPPTSVLVITGPNTGGKTVALKTVGLLALMAQSGLHVPAAEGSTLPVFRSVFADIGDEQSIAANLSTFSWHVTNIASMDRALALPALVLLDEVGAGTDPVEGGALGMAVIDHFRQRGANVVATTHYDTLKTYASTTPGVTAAAFGFTPEFEPTYRLLYGSPGRSLALEMAERLGLAPVIIEAARRHQSARESQLAEHLVKVDRQLQDLEHERRLAQREREQVTELDRRLRDREQALRSREEESRKRLETRVEERLRDARREIDAVVEDVKRRAATLVSQAARRAGMAASPVHTGETGAVRADARAALDRITDRLRDDIGARPAPSNGAEGSSVSKGDRVQVGPLGLEGIVLAIHGKDVEIDVRGKRLRSSLDQIRRVSGGTTGRATSRDRQVRVDVHEDAHADLNVIGCTVDEALSRADKFLDDALLSELRQVRVIHGRGTGQLKRALADFLAVHPLVAGFTSASNEQGGSAVTVVDLKD